MPQSSRESADLASCGALLRGGSRSFFAASLLLPRGIREPATALYAFCRVADDAIDCAGGAAAIAPLRARLHNSCAGRPADDPVDRALAAVVARYAMPVALLDALLDGFEWDTQGRRYETLSELTDYAARVAGSVGAMMAVLMDARAPDVVARACDLGVAMQLTNIARDVGEDARAGRLYLPLEWLRAAGIDPGAWLARPVFCGAIGGIVQRLLDEADRLYARAEVGIAMLPRACRPGIFAARRIYAEIGRGLERNACDSVTRRAVVPAHRKLALLARSVAPPAFAARGMDFAELQATRFIVDAVGATPRLIAARRSRWQVVDDRIASLLAMFERLNAAESAGRSGG